MLRGFLVPEHEPNATVGTEAPRPSRSCFDARGQCLALAMALHRRCGANSPARLLSDVSSTLIRLLWDDWIAGTEKKFLVNAWEKMISLKGDRPLPARAFSLGISRLTCGIVTPVASVFCDPEVKWLDWNIHVAKEVDDKLVLGDFSGKTPKVITLSDRKAVIEPRCVSVSPPNLVAFAGKGATGGLAGRNVIGIVDILGIGIPHDLEGGEVFRGSVDPTVIPVPSEVERIDFLPGDKLCVTLEEDTPKQFFRFLMMSTHGRLWEKMLADAVETRVTFGSGLTSIESVLRMRKKGGEYVLIVGAELHLEPQILEIPEGKEVKPGDIRWLRTKGKSGTNLSHISDSLFCCSSQFSHFCEIWDINNTSQPLKVVDLHSSHDWSPFAAMDHAKCAVAGNSGLIFHFVNEELNIIDPSSGLTVFRESIPRRFPPGHSKLNVWAPIT